MRLKITHLKAPWPQGAVVGDVLDLPSVPLWANGKCMRVGDDVEPTVEFAKPEPVRDLTAELAEVESKLAEAQAANAALIEGKAEVESKLAEAQAALASVAKTGKK